jgi:hypothetical protein
MKPTDEKIKEKRLAEMKKLGEYLRKESSIKALKTRPYVKKSER